MKLKKCFNLLLKGEAGEICSINFKYNQEKTQRFTSTEKKTIPIYHLKKKFMLTGASILIKCG
jgi:hypothetical protein